MAQWQCKKFDELSNEELFQIFKTRQDVFIVEQNCAYEDIDGFDEEAWHLIGFDIDAQGSKNIKAYLRILGPGTRYSEISLGRILVDKKQRGSGLGQELMTKAILIVEEKFPHKSIRISAQHHLQHFYAAFEFETVSDPYDEDGIPHIEMLKT